MPSPDDFKKYSEVLPNAPERIMSMAEKEQQIRADGQAGMLANERWRIYGSMLIGMSLIAVAALATCLGHAYIALPIGLAGAFVALILQIPKERIMSMAEKEQKIRAVGQAGKLANERWRIYGSMLIGMSLIAVAAVDSENTHWTLMRVPLLCIGLAGVFVPLIRQILNWWSQRQ